MKRAEKYFGREVPAGVPRELLKTAQRWGLDARKLVAGLAFDERALARPGTRVPWNDTARLFNRVGEQVGDDRAIEFAKDYTNGHPILRMLASMMVSPAVFYEVMHQSMRPTWPHLEHAQRRLARGRLEWTETLPSHYEGSHFYFLGTIGVLQAMPRLLLLDDAVVEGEVSTHGGTYRITLPASRTVAARGVRASLRAVVDGVRFELGSILGASTDDAPRVNVVDIQRAAGLTRAEARVAARLARGSTLTEIATDLGVAHETVRTHLKRALAKTGTHRQAELVAWVLRTRAP
jgi:DNA-binding CsgD family transcriptional regulator